MIGANPDQQKMLGTPANKQNAIRQSIQTGDSLQDKLRRNQGSSTATAEEKKSQEDAQRLTRLDQVDERLAAVTQQKIKEAAQATTSPLPDADRLKVDTLALEQFPVPPNIVDKEAWRAEFKTALEDVRNGNNPQQAMLKLAQLNGGVPVDINQIEQLFEKNTDKIAESMNLDLGNEVSLSLLSNEDYQELGFDGGKVEVEALLGVNPDTLTYKQFKERLAKVSSDSFSNVESLKQQASNPFLGATERAEARRRLVEMGAVGVRSAEEKVDNLQAQIEDGDTVTFNGKSWKIDDFLANGNVQGTIAEAINDPAKLEEMKAKEPELHAWIQNNLGVAASVAKGISQETLAFKQTQDHNKSFQTLPSGASVTDDLMEFLLPEFNDLSTQKIDPKNLPPLLQVLQSPDTTREQADNITASLQRLKAWGPKFAVELRGMNAQQLDNLGLLTGDKTKMQNFMDQQTRGAFLTTALDKNKDGVPDSNLSEAEIAKALFGDADAFKQSRELEQVMKQAEGMGVLSPQDKASLTQTMGQMKGLFDSTGKLDQKKFNEFIKKLTPSLTAYANTPNAAPDIDKLDDSLKTPLGTIKTKIETTDREWKSQITGLFGVDIQNDKQIIAESSKLLKDYVADLTAAQTPEAHAKLQKLVSLIKLNPRNTYLRKTLDTMKGNKDPFTQFKLRKFLPELADMLGVPKNVALPVEPGSISKGVSKVAEPIKQAAKVAEVTDTLLNPVTQTKILKKGAAGLSKGILDFFGVLPKGDGGPVKPLEYDRGPNGELIPKKKDASGKVIPTASTHGGYNTAATSGGYGTPKPKGGYSSGPNGGIIPKAPAPAEKPFVPSTAQGLLDKMLGKPGGKTIDGKTLKDAEVSRILSTKDKEKAIAASNKALQDSNNRIAAATTPEERKKEANLQGMILANAPKGPVNAPRSGGGGSSLIRQLNRTDQVAKEEVARIEYERGLQKIRDDIASQRQEKESNYAGASSALEKSRKEEAARVEAERVRQAAIQADIQRREAEAARQKEAADRRARDAKTAEEKRLAQQEQQKAADAKRAADKAKVDAERKKKEDAAKAEKARKDAKAKEAFLTSVILTSIPKGPSSTRGNNRSSAGRRWGRW